MMAAVAARRAYTDDEVEAAVQALSDPDRLDEAQRIVATQRAGAAAHPQPGARRGRLVRLRAPAAGARGGRQADIDERLRAVRTLLAEETQVSMLIGVAVGYELAHELHEQGEDQMAV